jgi:hypothetical protein
MKSQDNALKIIEVIKKNSGIETKQICDVLNITMGQFMNAKPFITNDCYRELKKWHMNVVDRVPPRIRRSPTATIIYKMMPVSQKGLKERMGMHKDSIWRALKLLKSHKLIHITGYESTNTTLFPTFAAGKGKDAPRPDGKELINARSNRYKERNIEKVREKNRKYREANREMLAEKSRARYALKGEIYKKTAREKQAIEIIMPTTQWRTALPWGA